MNSQRWPRRSSAVVPVGDGTTSWMPAGSTSSTHATGVHSSGCSIGTIPVNAPGATPTMVYGWPWISSVWPSDARVARRSRAATGGAR